MKSLRTIRGWVLSGTGLILILLSGTLHSNLIDMRKARHLQQVAPEDTTPLVAITTVAFGGFRGLVADALWVRANKMQEEGQYFEMVQLAKWITQLEPRVPEVWSFQAWNLAYNISVLFPEFEDRWRWVNHGLNLLRKEGLTNNPNSASIHWDIGWMFQHKIGMEFDLAHHLYKEKIREQMTAILPSGKLDAAHQGEKVKMALLQDFSMSLSEMQALETLYGPLEWRIPATHTLYWAHTGIPFAQNKFDERRLRRMEMQSLGELMRGGILIESADRQVTIRLPKLDLTDPVVAEYERMLAATPFNHYLQAGYKNFLQDATMLNADMGRMSEAYTYYEKLATVEEGILPGRENFQAFIQYQLTRDPTELNYNQAMSRLIGLIHQSLKSKNNEIRARGFRQMAEQFHRIYQQGRISEEHKTRTGLPPFETIYRLVEARQDI
jgi:hypothetical protein